MGNIASAPKLAATWGLASRRAATCQLRSLISITKLKAEAADAASMSPWTGLSWSCGVMLTWAPRLMDIPEGLDGCCVAEANISLNSPPAHQFLASLSCLADPVQLIP